MLFRQEELVILLHLSVELLWHEFVNFVEVDSYVIFFGFLILEYAFVAVDLPEDVGVNQEAMGQPVQVGVF